MPYEISIPPEGGYALIKWSGQISSEAIRQSGIDGIEFVLKEGLTRIFIDVTEVTNRLSVTELFLTTTEHSKLNSPRPKTALLGRSDQERELSFVETVAYNRNMRLKAFTDRDDAMSWLMK